MFPVVLAARLCLGLFFFSEPGSWRAVIAEVLLPLMATSAVQLLALQQHCPGAARKGKAQ